MQLKGIIYILISLVQLIQSHRHAEAFLFKIVDSYRKSRLEPRVFRCGCSSDHDADHHENAIINHVTLSARDARIKNPSLWLLTSFYSSMIPDPVQAVQNDQASFVQSLNLNFPRSLPNEQVVSRLFRSLQRRGYSRSNTLLATSLCSDELNSSEQSLESQLRKVLVPPKYGGVFHLGGLAGVPFVGASGFKAMLGHVPLDGKLLLVFGPHVGIDEAGNVGSVRRNGQGVKSTASCGAIVGASKALGGKQRKSAVNRKGGAMLMDEEEDFIISYLTKVSTSSVNKDHDVTITSLTQDVYQLIRDQVLSQLQACIDADPTAFWSKISELTLLGGIVINRDYTTTRKEDDYFQPLLLMRMNAQGTQDWLSEVLA